MYGLSGMFNQAALAGYNVGPLSREGTAINLHTQAPNMAGEVTYLSAHRSGAITQTYQPFVTHSDGATRSS